METTEYFLNPGKSKSSQQYLNILILVLILVSIVSDGTYVCDTEYLNISRNSNLPRVGNDKHELITVSKL